MRRATALTLFKTANAAVVLDCQSIEKPQRSRHVNRWKERETLAPQQLHGGSIVPFCGRNNIYPVNLAVDGGVVLSVNVKATTNQPCRK
ncbi:MAG: hypothetical protein IKN09_04855, partial [Clostridia bacterium]|nr:hypothetical protein [Clostridia bacterium]